MCIVCQAINPVPFVACPLPNSHTCCRGCLDGWVEARAGEDVRCPGVACSHLFPFTYLLAVMSPRAIELHTDAIARAREAAAARGAEQAAVLQYAAELQRLASQRVTMNEQHEVIERNLLAQLAEATRELALAQGRQQTAARNTAHDDAVRAANEQLQQRLAAAEAERTRVAVQRADLDRTEQLIRATTRPCPRCHAAVTKAGGCLHMTCRCSKQFYWCCLRDYPDENHRLFAADTGPVCRYGGATAE